MRLVTEVNALDQAIAQLYRVFARYRLAPHVDGCPHCVSEADIARVHSGRLTDLGTDDLAKYAFKAMTTWGTLDDFRHFLPRLLELIARDAGGTWIDPEVLFGKFAIGEWRRWPSEQREAVIGFLQALWHDVLARHPSVWEIDVLLCSTAQVVDDMLPYLSRWNVAGSPSAAMHFVDFAESATDGLSKQAISVLEPAQPLVGRTTAIFDADHSVVDRRGPDGGVGTGVLRVWSDRRRDVSAPVRWG